MPKNVKATPAAVKITERMINATVSGRGGPFTKAQQQGVEEMREGVRQGIYDKPRSV